MEGDTITSLITVVFSFRGVFPGPHLLNCTDGLSSLVLKMRKLTVGYNRTLHIATLKFDKESLFNDFVKNTNREGSSLKWTVNYEYKNNNMN